MDRNTKKSVCYSAVRLLSLSARRAWIEIASGTLSDTSDVVALRKESVDRNVNLRVVDGSKSSSRSPQGERG